MPSKSDVPTWFDLRKYDCFEHFTLTEWCDELEARGLALCHFRGEITYSGDDPTFHANLERSIRNQLDDLRQCGTVKALAARKGTAETSDQSCKAVSDPFGHQSRYPVRNLSQLEFGWVLVEEVPDPAEFLKRMSEIEAVPMFDIESRARLQAPLMKPVNEWFEDHFLQFRDSGATRKCVVHVDLAHSDEALREAFSNWLADQRRRTGWQSEGEITLAQAKRWHQQRLIPFIDLVLWQYTEKTSLPLHRIANALFPNDLDVDVTERVRKVTRPNADRICSPEFTERLRLYADAERALGGSRV